MGTIEILGNKFDLNYFISTEEYSMFNENITEKEKASYISNMILCAIANGDFIYKERIL